MISVDVKYRMRVKDIITENLEIPKLVYHGTTRRNLHSIMKDGLKPKLNKWMFRNRWQGQYPGSPNYDPPTPEEKAAETAISVTGNFEHARSYAEMGGSVGWRTDQTERDAVVLAFRPLPTDKTATEIGHDADFRFYNIITPDRLKIVYPERLIGREQDFISKGNVLSDFNAEKSARMKAINQQLKQAGATARIKSYKYSKPRWDVYAEPSTADWPGTIQTGGVVDITSTEFETWLTNQLK